MDAIEDSPRKSVCQVPLPALPLVRASSTASTTPDGSVPSTMRSRPTSVSRSGSRSRPTSIAPSRHSYMGDYHVQDPSLVRSILLRVHEKQW